MRPTAHLGARGEENEKIVLCPNPYRDHGLRMTQKVREILAEEGIESVISLPFQPEEMFYRRN